ncbi:hypothetical protein H310_00762 [Aphanomyces invadans]|uniref:Uncharacterized protein n=1 Tax=Aphanomyces invadans TaxID=157072 RepID=A0A024UX05_9STRA|nr:hypothetical protein H310_00762 [Aphanomyces invadans]ETW10462.1 hypothetical protein H310_00762 [Aphanomyces invadans]|eukprot:XP_008861873.1 hypothetical protein H310_00762 [Aphanomyces invadans]
MERQHDEGFSLLEDHEIDEAKRFTPSHNPCRRSSARPAWCHILRRRRIALVLLFVTFLIGVGVVLVTLVLKLKDTTVVLQRLHLPDVCNKTSLGAATLEFSNPSYCQPVIGPIAVVVDAANGNSSTRLLNIAVPEFPLASGSSVVTSSITFSIVANASTWQEVLFSSPAPPTLSMTGHIPVRLSCLLVPITVILDIHDVLHEPSSASFSLSALFTRALFQPFASPTDGDSFDIAARVRQMIHDIFQSIALSEGHLEQDKDGVYLFTDVTFQYSSSIQWSLPDLSFQLIESNAANTTKSNATILTAALYGFTLGAGATHLDSFAYLRHADSQPLLDAVTTYLRGDDVHLQVVGNDPLSACFAQRLWNDMHYSFKIPGTMDGKPAFLRQYTLDPTLKKLDSTTHTCDLRVDVNLTIHNPLPFELVLRHVQFDVLYRNVSEPQHKLMGTAVDVTAVDWKSHMVNDVAFSIVVTDFDVCEDLLVLFLNDALAFAIQRGNLTLEFAGGKAFDIPFQVDDIRVHPPPDDSAKMAMPDIVEQEDRIPLGNVVVAR